MRSFPFKYNTHAMPIVLMESKCLSTAINLAVRTRKYLQVSTVTMRGIVSRIIKVVFWSWSQTYKLVLDKYMTSQKAHMKKGEKL